MTSIVGTVTYALLALTNRGNIAPDWRLGVLRGLGGLVGGYLGTRLQPRLPERALRLPLGPVALGLTVLYLIQALA